MYMTPPVGGCRAKREDAGSTVIGTKEKLVLD
jgi:hypothetical protein